MNCITQVARGSCNYFPAFTWVLHPLTRRVLKWNISPLQTPSYHSHCAKRRTQNRISFCTRSSSSSTAELHYEKACSETLESLSDRLEVLLETENAPVESDITFANGVLTVQLGSHGTYVINKQTPNRQIWLSSPTSGPKRYDLIGNSWVYKHDGVSLHALLQEEFSKIFNANLDLSDCSFAGLDL